MRRISYLMVFSLGCGNTSPTNDAGSPASSATPVSASSAILGVSASSRKQAVSPRERREHDERACEANDVAACRKMADRYRGYGHIAGCGVSRDRPKPHRTVTASDAPGDAKLFDTWIRRACDLGDEDACLQGKNNVVSHSISEHDIDVCARGKQSQCALLLWQFGMHPDNEKKLKAKRLAYLKGAGTAGIFGDLFRKEKPSGAPLETLPKEVFDLADGICRSTLECDDVMMMLDKNGYGSAALLPLRKSAGEVLVSACLAGDCVCGESLSYLDATDSRRADLARIGCDNGEPDACYRLGRSTEETDPKNALALYDIACPSVSASDGREEVYSKVACDRISELNEEGRLVEKDSDRAFFYSTLACTRAGFERDHAPCLRRALFHARGYKGDLRWSTETNKEIARNFFYGIGSSPVDAKECERPSVQAICKRDADLITRAIVE